jgi:hypothetical protein
MSKVSNGFVLAMSIALSLTGSRTLAESPASKDPVVLVFAADVEDVPDGHYEWAAEMVAARLKGNLETFDGDFGQALRFARENPGKVSGIVEIIVDVYTLREEVRITCSSTTGKELWKDKAVVNMGGGEETLARKMVERAIKKAERRPACGGK